MAKTAKIKYSLDGQGCFVIENYNQAKPFSNFFPGIAGLWGIPMWVFYVNRGQGIASFGIHGKDKSLVEFQPANKAYRLTSLQGFRTFLKLTSGSKKIFWEPFQNHSGVSGFKTKQVMRITSHDLTIEEENAFLGIGVRVNYFTLPQEPLAALIRRVTIINLGRKKWNVELVDGLPVFFPYGLNDWAAKNMSRTVEAWVNVRGVDKKTPYYHLRAEVADTPQVKHIKEGNFYFSFEKDGAKAKLLEPIVEAACVFGSVLDFVQPETFMNAAKFQVPRTQQTSNRTPAAMSFSRFSLGGREEKTFIAAAGFAHSEAQLSQFAAQALRQDFVAQKAAENKAVVEEVKHFAFTRSSSPEFDLYCQQTFLDNVLRGGLPVSLKTGEGVAAFNVFSRKHGDLERDYNWFVLAPTYFSQGNGNYRDVNQNRRNDVWFNADVKENHIVNFLSLIQADGYNPLVVKGMTFSVGQASRAEAVLKELCAGEVSAHLKEMLVKGFQPGELLQAVEQEGIKLKISLKDFLSKILGVSQKHESADHGEGFWTDHWTYNTDLLESFVAVYPDQFAALLLEKKVFSFYFNSHYVLPRDHRYILTAHGVRQYHSVHNDPKTTKAAERGHKLHTKHGEGEVYHTHLLAKLVCLLANKAATLDPSGIGVEMEADKPNWYDALNGLPGLVGSSISETFEIKRLAVFLLNALEQAAFSEKQKISIFIELYNFVTELKNVLASATEPLDYWSRANEAKEHYRFHTRAGIEGAEKDMTIAELKEFLKLIVQRTSQGTAAAKDRAGLYPTYFYHEITDYQKMDRLHAPGVPYVKPLKFRRQQLPLFLEGFVHALRVAENVPEARALYQGVRRSPLFDKKLAMYKVNAQLAEATEEIGRARIFPPGWLENESIWLHMEYKFLLELLRCGLYEEFYENFNKALIPFLKPEQYGRSTLESSSFIVSSIHEDASLHGQGFVARLSGSTAEFLHMWLWMNLGKQPFRLSRDGQLTLTLAPALPGWLFSEKAVKEFPKNSYAFNLFGTTRVVYHNPKRKNTFGQNSGVIKRISLTYPGRKNPVMLSSATIPAPYSHEIRDRKVERIDVEWE